MFFKIAFKTLLLTLLLGAAGILTAQDCEQHQALLR